MKTTNGVSMMEKEEMPLLATSCVLCGDKLTDDNWQPCRKERNQCRCSKCCNLKAAEWKKNNKDKVKATKAVWDAANKHRNKIYKSRVTGESIRKYSIKTSYGISWENYLKLYNEAGGKCSICSLPLAISKTDGLETAHVDHDHASGKVRGILCRTCNRGIGYLQDSPRLLISAAAYLQNTTIGH